MEDCCQITDSLKMARSLYPMQKNSLDALCNRLGVSNQHRTLHGALIDTEILAEVYLKMTSSQEELNLKAMHKDDQSTMSQGQKKKYVLKIVNPSNDEMQRLQQFLEKTYEDKLSKLLFWIVLEDKKKKPGNSRDTIRRLNLMKCDSRSIIIQSMKGMTPPLMCSLVLKFVL